MANADAAEWLIARARREDEGIAKRDRPPPEMRSRLKKRVWLLFEHPDSSLFAKLLALISCAFVLISVCVCVRSLESS